jgi:hypothetical protein
MFGSDKNTNFYKNTMVTYADKMDGTKIYNTCVDPYVTYYFFI